VVAGHDTTSFCLTSTLFWVATHARVKAKLLAEIEAFGWERHVTPDNQEQLPYLDVSGAWRAMGCALLAR
jgi:cytochrome P450